MPSSCPHGIVAGQCNACLATTLTTEATILRDLRGIRRWRSCSWCRHSNRDTVRWCAQCGHAAQLPRLECDCAACHREFGE